MLGETAKSYRESLELAMRRYSGGDQDPAEVVAEMMAARWPQYAERLEKVLPGAFAQAIADAATAFEVELPGLLDWSFGEEDARKITQPVLSVLGEKSESLWPRFGEVHRYLLAELPNSEGFVLLHATHFLQVENPEEMAVGLRSFLGRHPFA
jgi:pimeloyl-ACP methyl ester carboxylesterase